MVFLAIGFLKCDSPAASFKLSHPHRLPTTITRLYSKYIRRMGRLSLLRFRAPRGLVPVTTRALAASWCPNYRVSGKGRSCSFVLQDFLISQDVEQKTVGRRSITYRGFTFLGATRHTVLDGPGVYNEPSAGVCEILCQ